MKTTDFKTERTRIISEMLDNPDEHGIYPTTKCFKQLDKLYESHAIGFGKYVYDNRKPICNWFFIHNISWKELYDTFIKEH